MDPIYAARAAVGVQLCPADHSVRTAGKHNEFADVAGGLHLFLETGRLLVGNLGARVAMNQPYSRAEFSPNPTSSVALPVTIFPATTLPRQGSTMA
jgi:hypothetical protein